MKKILKYVLIVFVVLFIKFFFTFVLNEFIIMNYHNGIYSTNLISALSFFNFSESYIVPYNHGNIMYQLGQYDEAILKYRSSLDKKPPQERVCEVRINLSLAILKTISSQSFMLPKLVEARENLYENHCANEFDDNGYSPSAEKLEQEIRELEKNYKNDSANSSNDETIDEKEENNVSSSIEEKLKENEKKANSSRQEDIMMNENFNNYEYYSGKRW